MFKNIYAMYKILTNINKTLRKTLHIVNPGRLPGMHWSNTILIM